MTLALEVFGPHNMRRPRLHEAAEAKLTVEGHDLASDFERVASGVRQTEIPPLPEFGVLIEGAPLR